MVGFFFGTDNWTTANETKLRSICVWCVLKAFFLCWNGICICKSALSIVTPWLVWCVGASKTYWELWEPSYYKYLQVKIISRIFFCILFPWYYFLFSNPARIFFLFCYFIKWPSVCAGGREVVTIILSFPGYS